MKKEELESPSAVAKARLGATSDQFQILCGDGCDWTGLFFF